MSMEPTAPWSKWKCRYASRGRVFAFDLGANSCHLKLFEVLRRFATSQMHSRGPPIAGNGIDIWKKHIS